VTYSIVARDPQTGQLGGAVQSHWFAAGNGVIWAESGVGVVATQALLDESYGPLGLDLMRGGKSADEALRALVEVDPGRDERQAAFVDARGRVAAHTGSRCLRAAGHTTGDGFSCQANMMLSDTVWGAMREAFVSTEGDLVHRLLAALDAAEAEGGDIRGKQAAGILVVRAESTGQPWRDRVVDIRVDDHPEPLVELRRLVELKLAYDRMERADELEQKGDLEGAVVEYRAALATHGDAPEIRFWAAIAFAKTGALGEARELLGQLSHPGWAELLRRMVSDGSEAPDLGKLLDSD